MSPNPWGWRPRTCTPCKGYFDDVPVDRIKECQNAWEATMKDQHPDLLESILREKDLTPEIDAGLKAAIESFKLSWN